MFRHHEHGLDVRLMRILHILLDECSVSRTADLLGQSQPAVSLALKRLREILGDPLLVRSGSRLVPTERGLEVGRRVARILADIDGMVEADAHFEPGRDTRQVRIYAANCLGTFFMPCITQTLRREAPGMQVVFCATPDEQDVFSELESGDIDLVVVNWPCPPENLRFAPLLDVDMVLVMRQDHRFADRRALTMAEYMALDHLSPTPHSAAAISPVDGRLAQLDLKRRIAVTVPEFSLVPHVLARTDLVFTSSRPFAEQMAGHLPFAIVEAPPELGRMKFYLLWHERLHHSPCNRWLRNLIRGIAGDHDGLGLLRSPKMQNLDISLV